MASDEVNIGGYPCRYELVEVSTVTQEIDPELEAIFTETQQKLEIYLDQFIGHFEKDIIIDDVFSARKDGHSFIEFLHNVQLETSKADISVNSIFDTAIGFKKDVTIRDVLINYPYPNTLKVLEVSGHNLKKAMEKSATYFVLEDGEVVINDYFLKPKVQNYNYDTFGGLTYTIDITRAFGDRVMDMCKDGVAMDLDKKYSVVMNNYRASNTSIYPSYKDAPIIKELDIDVSEIIIDYIQSKGTVLLDNMKNYKVKCE